MNKAIVFIDVQKDFIDGALRNEKAIEVTPKIVDFAKSVVSYVNNDIKLYATLDTHEKTIYDNVATPKATYNPELPISGYMTTLEGQKLPVEHCIEGSEGWEMNDDLWDIIGGKCTVITKPTFGSFDLAEIISEDYKNTTPDEIILVGFCTSICVTANAVILRAKFPNTKITVMKDLCACVNDDTHKSALDVLQMQQIDVR